MEDRGDLRHKRWPPLLKKKFKASFSVERIMDVTISLSREGRLDWHHFS